MSTSPAGLQDGNAVNTALAEVGRHWSLLFLFGLVSTAVGVIALVWPGKTIVVVAVFFGAWLLVSGVFQVIEAFSPGLDGGARAMLAVSGAVGIILGLMCFRSVVQAVEILALIVGLAWLIRGVLTFVTGLTARGVEGRGWIVFGGIVLALGGVVVLVWPGLSLVSLAVVSGIWLIVFGVIEMAGAVQVRRAVRTAA